MLLALDTSTRTIGVALYDGQRVAFETLWSSQDYHTVELGPTVALALERAGTDVAGVKAVAVATGPGSFTGLRVGMSFAKGLALARRLPLIGMSTLDVLASAQPIEEDTPLAAVLQAGRGRLAVGWYQVIAEAWQATGEVGLITPEKLAARIRKPTIICGELDDQTRRLLGRKYKNAMIASPARSARRPALLAELAWARWQAGESDDPATLSPLYLHHNE
jgi:tRNA threonylcarbamoyladenosine biosynthesis protein TsaB